MPYVELNDQNIFYAKHDIIGGTKPHSSVVLIHAAAGSHLDWPLQLRHLPGVTVFAIDLPGHGRSQGPFRSSIDQYAGDVMALIAALKLDNVVLVGHSMGGAIVQNIGLWRPAEVIKLVLLSTGARLRVMPEVLDGILSDYEVTVKGLSNFLWSDEAPDELRALGRKTLLNSQPEIVHADYSACNRFDNMDRLGDIQLPTLVICGTKDKMTPLKYSQYLAEKIPHSRLEVIGGGGHMVALEQPERVADAISRFLETS